MSKFFSLSRDNKILVSVVCKNFQQTLLKREDQENNGGIYQGSSKKKKVKVEILKYHMASSKDSFNNTSITMQRNYIQTQEDKLPSTNPIKVLSLSLSKSFLVCVFFF